MINRHDFVTFFEDFVPISSYRSLAQYITDINIISCKYPQWLPIPNGFRLRTIQPS